MSSNPATLYATTLINALASSGLHHVCIAPGSRSTPLTLAFEAQPEMEVHVHLDERSAGFMALGLAMKTGRPVALVCTSGTAAANFYPAVIEAFMSQVPLIVLTADRPPELRHSGANQTIDQVKMYGDHVLWAVDLDVPTAKMPAVALRNAATTAARAFQVAAGLRRGPVHINVPFRKPLEPQGDYRPRTTDHRRVEPNPGLIVQGEHSGLLMPTESQVAALVDLIERHPRGLIVCGPGGPGGGFAPAVAALAQTAGWPLAADPLSQLRCGPWVGETPLWTTYETTLAGGQKPPWPDAEVVIRFGGVPTSKWLNHYLDVIESAVRLHVRASGLWADDGHRTTDFWQVDEKELCERVVADLRRQTTDDRKSMAARRSHFGTPVPSEAGGLRAAPDQPPDSLSNDQQPTASSQRLTSEGETGVWQKIETFMATHNFDAAVVYHLFEHLQEGTNVMIGNSLPIRHVDQFARPATRRLNLFGNRGASGIDGIISTAVGIAKADPDHPTVLIIGDISFFHDANGLLPVPELPNLVIVLLHNDGGSIFRRLPIAEMDPPFTRLFLTPHGLDFAPLAAMHGIPYQKTTAVASFLTAVQTGLNGKGPLIIEYRSNGANDETLRRELIQEVQGRE